MNKVVATVSLILAGCALATATDYTTRVPTYGAGHQPQQQTSQQTDVLLARILETLLRIELRLGGKTETIPPPVVVDGVQALAVRCANCHSAAKPEGELVLVEKDGTLALLSVEQRRTIQRRVNAGSMPPPKVGALSAPEKSALLSLIGPKSSPVEEKKE